MRKLPSVAIVIPAYNEEESIEKCIISCLDQTVPASEIVVVNNRSSDRTAEIVETLIRQYPEGNIQMLNQDRVQGITPTRNLGLNSAKSKVIGRIDADSIIDRQWVEVVGRAFIDPSVDAITGPVLYYDMPLRKIGFRVDDRIRAALYKLAKKHRFLFGSNMAIRSTAWSKVKDMTNPDEENLLHEDVDLALTLSENGHVIAYAPDMVASLSARRLEDSPKEFYKYVMRFERTYKAHSVKSATARVPIFIYLLIYFPARTIRKFYDGEESKFTLRKLGQELKALAEFLP